MINLLIIIFFGGGGAARRSRDATERGETSGERGDALTRGAIEEEESYIPSSPTFLWIIAPGCLVATAVNCFLLIVQLLSRVMLLQLIGAPSFILCSQCRLYLIVIYQNTTHNKTNTTGNNKLKFSSSLLVSFYRPRAGPTTYIAIKEGNEI